MRENEDRLRDLVSPERLEHIRQLNKLVSVLCNLGSGRMREKEEEKKRATEVEENRRQKYEEKQVRKTRKG